MASRRVRTCRRVVLTGALAPADRGACQQIIDGKIKIKNDSQIERFTKTGLKFDNGSELEADVVMYATGCATLLHYIASRHMS